MLKNFPFLSLLNRKQFLYNNHRTVLDGNLKAGELLFINGSNLSISFCKIAFDTYLIIGVHSINEGFNLDINRYHLNKKYIEELKEHLQFNLELLLKADASYELYQSFLILHQNDKEKEFSHLFVIIIDALVTNCVIITTRLIDKREKINIYNTIKHTIKCT